MAGPVCNLESRLYGAINPVCNLGSGSYGAIQPMCNLGSGLYGAIKVPVGGDVEHTQEASAR